MNAATILAIPLDQPERIFPNSEIDAKRVRSDLLQKWYPDFSKDPDASKVTDHIVKLFDKVIEKINKGIWAPPNTLVFNCTDGKERTIKYRSKRGFELGEMAYGDRVLCYVIRPDASDLFENGLETIKQRLTFKDDKMRGEMEKYLPVVLDNFKTKDGTNVLVLSKTPDVFLVQDVLDALDGKIDPVHVAWIMSAFHNIACYLQYADLTHNAISSNTTFISPEHHSGLLLGGWWYSQKAGSKLKALPGFAINSCPSNMLKDKIADSVLDLSLIRSMGLELMGDSTGMCLLHDGKTPKPMINFLRDQTKGNAVEDYKKWSSKILLESFGKRRFVEMSIKASDIFKE